MLRVCNNEVRLMYIVQNIKRLSQRIEDSAHRVRRDPKSIRLVAVTKNVRVEGIIEAAKAGVDTFGENYAQELRDKYIKVGKAVGREVKWHFIGRIQKNKVKYIVGNVELIQSLDSIKIAEEINRRAEWLRTNVPVLIEVNADEEQKGGVKHEAIEEFLEILEKYPNIIAKGLMIMPPYSDEKEMARPYFKGLRELRDKLQRNSPEIIELSMGMSEDFEVAIEEGATILRIGTAIFGPRA